MHEAMDPGPPSAVARRLVVVMGSPRSGTSALFTSLALAPGVTAFPEGATAVYRDTVLRPREDWEPLLSRSRHVVLVKPLRQIEESSFVDLQAAFVDHEVLAVWIYRRAEDVLLSAWRRGWIQDSPEAFVTAANIWIAQNERALGEWASHRDCVAIVSLDDLCNKPGKFHELCAWLELDAADLMWTRSGPTRTSPLRPHSLDAPLLTRIGQGSADCFARLSMASEAGVPTGRPLRALGQGAFLAPGKPDLECSNATATDLWDLCTLDLSAAVGDGGIGTVTVDDETTSNLLLDGSPFTVIIRARQEVRSDDLNSDAQVEYLISTGPLDRGGGGLLVGWASEDPWMQMPGIYIAAVVGPTPIELPDYAHSCTSVVHVGVTSPAFADLSTRTIICRYDGSTLELDVDGVRGYSVRNPLIDLQLTSVGDKNVYLGGHDGGHQVNGELLDVLVFRACLGTRSIIELQTSRGWS